MNALMAQPTAEPIDLSGRWTVVLDPHTRGEREGWATGLGDHEAHAVELPGSIQAQHLGDDVDVSTEWVGAAVDHPFFHDDRYAPYRTPGDVKIPFWLQPNHVYVGHVWYQRTFEVADGQDETDLQLTLERVHWQSTVWIDGVRVGSERSLTTPHRFRVPAMTRGSHLIVIRVDNSMIVDVGTNSHSVSDHTQGGWNGIIGEISLTPLPPARVAEMAVFPDIERREVRVSVSIAVDSLRGCEGALRLSARGMGHDRESESARVRVDVLVPEERFTRGRAELGTHLDIVLPLGEHAPLWDEFDPVVYELTATLEATVEGKASLHRRTTSFGLRVVDARDTQIHVNGRPTFLRGTLECCVFPLTGYPPTDQGSWARIFDTCRRFGLNHVRFHSWCPPEAAFRAADEAGMYLQVEGPIWANQGAAIGEGRDVDDFLFDESRRIVREYGDHPSFIMMAHGNEPAGRDAQSLSEWVGYWRRRDDRRLYTSAGGWPVLSESDFDCIPEPRIQRWGEGLASRINGAPPETRSDYAEWVAASPRPIITHEAGQWCAYPNLAEMAKYTGVMAPRNFEIVRDFLDQAGLSDQAADFLHASGRLQVLCYKEDIEAALRTPGFGGVQLLGLTDFPGQGTAPVGVLDVFWEEKGYIGGAEFARFFSETVPLAILDKRVWSSDETLTAAVRIAHFGAGDLDGRITWRLVGDDGAALNDGAFEPGVIAVGNRAEYGEIRVPLGAVRRAQRVRLVVDVSSDDACFENDWELWVYPARLEERSAQPSDETVVTDDLAAALDGLAAGRTVVFVPSSDDVRSPVEFGFSTVFWNTSWTRGQAPHTLGVLCDPEHPALASFPTDAHTNWQWWELVHGAKALDVTALGAAARPIVQVIDSWFDARRLGLIVEARVGHGRLLVCTIDILSDHDTRLVARQLHASILRYVAGGDFAPALSLTPDEVRGLLVGGLGASHSSEALAVSP